MTARLIAFTGVCFAMTGISVATELAPINAHSIRLASFDGIVYYTVEPDGYRVVATLAAGPEATPIRFVATLGPGQHMLISVPQAVNRPSIDVDIRRDGDALVVSAPSSTVPVDLADQVTTGTPPDQ